MVASSTTMSWAVRMTKRKTDGVESRRRSDESGPFVDPAAPWGELAIEVVAMVPGPFWWYRA
jgi:hypothetical protein